MAVTKGIGYQSGNPEEGMKIDFIDISRAYSQADAGDYSAAVTSNSPWRKTTVRGKLSLGAGNKANHCQPSWTWRFESASTAGKEKQNCSSKSRPYANITPAWICNAALAFIAARAPTDQP